MKLLLVTLLALCGSARTASLSNSYFSISIDNVTGAVVEIIDPKSSSNESMNWVSGPRNAPWQPPSSRWGLGFADLGQDLLHRYYWTSPQIHLDGEHRHTSTYIAGPLQLLVTRTLENDSFTEQYTFTNNGEEAMDLSSRGVSALGIFTPFNDHYTNTSDALHSRCHAHVWADGGSTAWVKMEQMGGKYQNLGLVLTDGSLTGYSIESRDTITLSNTRGVFVLHPDISVLEPGQVASIGWSMFWHDDWEDFFAKCQARSEQFIRFDAEDFTLLSGESVRVNISGAVDVNTTVNGEAIECDGSSCSFSQSSGSVGQHELVIQSAGKNSIIYLKTVPGFDDLIDNRTRFIIEHQQLSGVGNVTNGAYAVFDTQAMVPALWETSSDRSLGRERVGMGILMSRWLRENPASTIVRDSLVRYYSFASLNLQDATGYVLNRPGTTSSRDSKRLYNWPWVIQLHTSVAIAHEQGALNLTGPVAGMLPVDRAMLTLESFYSEGGQELYAIGLPILELLRFLEQSGRTEYLERALSLFVAHGEVIVSRGLDYPPFEVNFEQSIVAPAAIMLLELYRFTGNQTWLDAAEIQLQTLLRFEGKQPDHRVHEVAIRHWDGYWFGKDRLWGDTFPHHWSTLDAVALHHYGEAVDDDSFNRRADRIIRANLALFSADGKAGCAWIYPRTVNGRAAHARDTYANDQDWALNHLLYIRRN